MSINSINGNTLLTSGSFPPVRAASTGSPLTPTTGGLLLVDGVQLAAGDRVLCKDEASAVNNGIYAANTGPWVRTTDASGNQHFFSGMKVTSALGALNAGLDFICTCTDDPVVVGASLLTFAAQSVVATATQSATSTSSFLIGTGSKAFATQAGKAFAVNQWVLIQETSVPANQMLGQITGYSGATLTVNVTATGGNPGPHADWTIVLTNSAAAAGYQPPVGSGNVIGPGSSTAGHVATYADGTGKVLLDGGVPVGGANTITPSMFASAAVALGFNMLNGTLVATSTDANTSLTIAVKTLAGADPSPADPAFFLLRSGTPGSASYSIIEVTAALSTKIPASSTMGFTNGNPGKVWMTAVNNGGVVSLAVINCLLGTSIYQLAGWGIANITAYGGGANTAQVLYGTGTLASMPYSVLGYFAYETGSVLATAGTWATAPSRMELYRPGVALPGTVIQNPRNDLGAMTTGTTTVAFNNSTPQNTAGDQYMSQAIVPSSSAHLLAIEHQGQYANSAAAGTQIAALLCQDSAANALAITTDSVTVSNNRLTLQIRKLLLAATLASTTFKIRAGGSTAGTTTFNGSSGAAEFNGFYNSFLEVAEIAT